MTQAAPPIPGCQCMSVYSGHVEQDQRPERRNSAPLRYSMVTNVRRVEQWHLRSNHIDDDQASAVHHREPVQNSHDRHRSQGQEPVQASVGPQRPPAAPDPPRSRAPGWSSGYWRWFRIAQILYGYAWTAGSLILIFMAGRAHVVADIPTPSIFALQPGHVPSSMRFLRINDPKR
jgi:hypothetical protein